jgi:hypothetical protein
MAEFKRLDIEKQKAVLGLSGFLSGMDGFF